MGDEDRDASYAELTWRLVLVDCSASTVLHKHDKPDDISIVLRFEEFEKGHAEVVPPRNNAPPTTPNRREFNDLAPNSQRIGTGNFSRPSREFFRRDSEFSRLNMHHRSLIR